MKEPSGSFTVSSKHGHRFACATCDYRTRWYEDSEKRDRLADRHLNKHRRERGLPLIPRGRYQRESYHLFAPRVE